MTLAHMGMIQFPETLVFPMLEGYAWWPRNVYYDLSATATFLADSPFAEQLAWTVRKLGVDRVMFGSDFPMFAPDAALAALDRLGFSPDERRALLHDTAAQLFALE